MGSVGAYRRVMGSGSVGATPEEFFAGHPEGLELFRAVARLVDGCGPADVRVSRSQIAFRRRHGFAYVWRPGQYVASEVPAVLSIALPRHVWSDRFKAVAHPSPRIWMHHLELRDPAQLDDEVRSWMREAWSSAG